jgi:hypothetical protein
VQQLLSAAIAPYELAMVNRSVPQLDVAEWLLASPL